MIAEQEACTMALAEKKIVIVDDHPLLRKGLATVINQEPDLVVEGESDDARKALELIVRLKPDLVIIDISLPGIDGIELLNMLKAQLPDLCALVVSMHDESIFAERALRAEAGRKGGRVSGAARREAKVKQT